MKNTKILVDTNVVIDWLTGREPFYNAAESIIKECISGKVDGYLTSHMMTDLFYILRKNFDVEKRKQLLLLLCRHFQIITEDKDTISSVLQDTDTTDLEDGLQMKCAEKSGLDYIITRDIDDFKCSEISVLTPIQYREMIESHNNDDSEEKS